MKSIFKNIKNYFVNINSYKTVTVNKSVFSVIDTETTGLDVREGHRIVSIGATKIKNLKIVTETLDELVNPERKISQRSIDIHHITDAKVKNKPTLRQLDNKIFKFIDGTILVGHNLKFDINFIIKSAPLTVISHKVKHLISIDTILLTAGLYPTLKSFELSYLCKHFKIKTKDQVRHSAVGDSIVTARLFLFLLDQAKIKNKINNIGGLLKLCKQGDQILYLTNNFNKIH